MQTNPKPSRRVVLVDVELLRETVTRLGEHEILLAFNHDDDATKFFEWWNSVGLRDFSSWHEKQPN